MQIIFVNNRFLLPRRSYYFFLSDKGCFYFLQEWDYFILTLRPRQFQFLPWQTLLLILSQTTALYHLTLESGVSFLTWNCFLYTNNGNVLWNRRQQFYFYILPEFFFLYLHQTTAVFIVLNIFICFLFLLITVVLFQLRKQLFLICHQITGVLHFLSDNSNFLCCLRNRLFFNFSRDIACFLISL